MSRLLDIMGGKPTTQKEAQTGSRLMRILKDEDAKRKEEAEEIYWQQKADYTKAMREYEQAEKARTAEGMTAKDALDKEGLRRFQSKVTGERQPLPLIPQKPVYNEPLSMNLGDNQRTGGYLANRFISGLVGSAEGLAKMRELMQPKTDIPGLGLSPEESRQTDLENKRYQDRTETALAGKVSQSLFGGWATSPKG